MNLDGNQTSIREAIDAGLLAGAVTLVWQAGKVLQVSELGHRDVHAGSPMQRDTIFRIASMSKPVTVAAAMALVEEGKFALTDPVAPHLPELAELRVMADPDGPLDRTVPLRRPITFDDLMTHRSGLAYRFSVGPPLSRAYDKLMFRQDQDRWLAELAALPLAHQPGERLTYSHATDVLGIALSRIEGKPLVGGAVRTCLRTPRHGRHRLRGEPGRTQAGRHDVHARREQHAAGRRDGTRTDHAADVLHGRGRTVVDGRRLPRLRPHAARRRHRRTVCGCCRRSPCG